MNEAVSIHDIQVLQPAHQCLLTGLFFLQGCHFGKWVGGFSNPPIINLKEC